MDVSVALCTFRGERFLAAQLESIAAQTVLPAEVVVCDDGSTDGTVDIVARFTADAPFPVRLHANPENLGVTANFAGAIARCRGAIIALADQDDVWAPEKLERLVAAFEDHPEAGAVFSDAELVDEALRPLGRTLFHATGFTAGRRRRFAAGHALDVLVARPVVCGATLTFRSSFRDLVLPIPGTGLHDIWIAGLLASVSEIVVLPEPLVRYRQHGANQVGAASRGLRAKLATRRRQGVLGDEIAHYRAMAERLRRAPAGRVDPHALRLLGRKVEHLEFRYGLPRHRVGAVLAELLRGRYHRYSRGLESAGYDLLFRRASGTSSEAPVAAGGRPAPRRRRPGWPGLAPGRRGPGG
ncbi:MAG TPA: glycosyltransferase family 2 protein [Acidimicrobiales bacterium]|nr:glycosyltransferase family 2 protein [Acidimicrobiales bacterium]